MSPTVVQLSLYMSLWCPVTATITALMVQHAASALIYPGAAVRTQMLNAVVITFTAVHMAPTVTEPLCNALLRWQVICT